MSVQRFLPASDPDAWFANTFRQQCCFYCGHGLASPFVIWMGFGEPIALHPACVVELAIRLFRDVHEIECAANAYITSRTLPELRERLRQEEGLRGGGP